MKKQYLYAATVLAFASAFPAFASAQIPDNQGPIGVDASVTVEAQTQPAPVPVPVPANIRDRIRADIQTRVETDIHNHVENARNNQDYRNTILMGARFSTSTRPGMGSTTTMRTIHPFPNDAQFGSSTIMGSSTMRARFENGYTPDSHGIMLGLFKARKVNAVKQLQTALSNLTQIRTRIDERILTEQHSGRDMSDAIALLEIADTQIASATVAVNAVSTYMPSASSSAEMTASTTINLAMARQLLTTAQLAIKGAQKSLNAVVVSIAHSMGFKIGQDGTIIAPASAIATTSATVTITSSTTTDSVTASTSASTTSQ